MKTCLIYSPDGVDLDTAVNLKYFYKRLGFNAFFSDELIDADILVLVRAADKPVGADNFNFSLIHIYDYVGWDYDAAVKSFDFSKTYICCTSDTRRKRIVEELGFPEDHIRVALVPVEISLWTRKIKPIKYDAVHIGTYKPIPGGDAIQEDFIDILAKYKVHVWGGGWKNIISEEYWHGKMKMFGVPDVYSRSKFALGFMYPFQRDVTFSGRFWIAPLCGCPLISEKGLYTKKVPGVIETDYSNADYERIMNEISVDRGELKNEAIAFWEKENEATLSFLKPSSDSVNARKYGLGYRLRVYKIKMQNRRRIFYQTSFIFNLVKKLKPS